LFLGDSPWEALRAVLLQHLQLPALTEVSLSFLALC
jgi:hypothetical protein